jgi:hypothetical protein
VTGYEEDYRGSAPDRMILLFIIIGRTSLQPIPSSVQWAPVIKRYRCEADNSLPPNAEVMNVNIVNIHGNTDYFIHATCLSTGF